MYYQQDTHVFCRYYKEGKTYKKGDFLDPKLLDCLIDQIKEANAAIRAANVTRAAWLGETSSFSGGGVPGVSDSYKAGFM